MANSTRVIDSTKWTMQLMRLGLGLTPGQSYIVIWLSCRGFKFQIWLTASMLLKSAYGQQNTWGQKVLCLPTSRGCSCANITTKQQTNNFTDRHFHGSTTAKSPWSKKLSKKLVLAWMQLLGESDHKMSRFKMLRTCHDLKKKSQLLCSSDLTAALRGEKGQTKYTEVDLYRSVWQ